jgi:hypothetical protein
MIRSMIAGLNILSLEAALYGMEIHKAPFFYGEGGIMSRKRAAGPEAAVLILMIGYGLVLCQGMREV